MIANVFVPHVVASVVLRSFMPGTATAVLLNLPLGCLFLYRALAEGLIQPRTFVWAAPLTGAAMLASIPVLFVLGRWLFPE